MTIKTIKPSGGDYATLTGWKSSLSSTLSAPQQADIYSFGPGGLVEAGGVAFSGFTTTATNKLILNVPPGERHTGVAHSGAYITNVSGSSGITTIRLGSFVDYFEVHGLEVESLDTAASAWHWNLSCDVGNSFVMDHCIIHAISMPIGAFAPNGIYTYRNTVFYCTTASRILDTRGTKSVELSNCTAYTQRGDFVYVCDTEATIINCYGGGSSNEVYCSGGNPAGNHNASSDATATRRFLTGSINNISGASVFKSVMSGSEDFHLKAGDNPLVNAGTSVAGVKDDIIGTPRPQGPAYDISAFERKSGGSRGDLMPGLNGIDVRLGAMVIAPAILARMVKRRSLLKGLWLPWI